MSRYSSDLHRKATSVALGPRDTVFLQPGGEQGWCSGVTGKRENEGPGARDFHPWRQGWRPEVRSSSVANHVPWKPCLSFFSGRIGIRVPASQDLLPLEGGQAWGTPCKW